MNYKECAYFSLYKQSPWIYKNYTFEISSSIRQQISRHPFAIHVVPRTQTNEHIEHTRSRSVAAGHREEQLLQGGSEEDFGRP